MEMRTTSGLCSAIEPLNQRWIIVTECQAQRLSIVSEMAGTKWSLGLPETNIAPEAP
jgi:hypothetical protein